MTKSEQLLRAAEVIKQGGVVVYPTDTAYGLAVDATNIRAVKKLYELKGRNFNKPVHVIFPSLSQLDRVVKLNLVSKQLIQKFFPGRLTLVLPLKKNSGAWKILSADTATLGFRVPHHKLVRAFLKLLNRPITTTSANLSGKGNCYSVQQVKKQFQGKAIKPDFYLNGGKIKRIKPSTVIQVQDNKIKLLREGPVTFDEIKKSLS